MPLTENLAEVMREIALIEEVVPVLKLPLVFLGASQAGHGFFCLPKFSIDFGQPGFYKERQFISHQCLSRSRFFERESNYSEIAETIQIIWLFFVFG